MKKSREITGGPVADFSVPCSHKYRPIPNCSIQTPKTTIPLDPVICSESVDVTLDTLARKIENDFAKLHQAIVNPGEYPETISRNDNNDDDNVLMFSFEGIMKLMTEDSQEKTERSEVFTGCLRSSISLFPNKLNINTIIIRFPTYPITNSGCGTHCYPLFIIFDNHKFLSMRPQCSSHLPFKRMRDRVLYTTT